MCFNSPMFGIYLLIAPFVPGAAFTDVGPRDQVSSSVGTRLAWFRICACFTFSREELLWYRCVDLGLSKELGSLGKLSEVCKKPRDAEGIVTKAAFMSEREAHKCMFCKDLTACCTGAS